MITSLSTLNLLILGSYLVVLIALGFLATRNSNIEGFLIADRSLNVLNNTSTILATKTGAGIMLTGVAIIYLHGISAMWYFIGASTGYILFLFFATELRKISTKKKFYTLSDYFFDKFGKTTGFLSAILTLLTMLFALILQLIGGAKVLQSISGFSFEFSLIVIALTILVYTSLGGFKAVVVTDVAQLLTILLLLSIFIITSGAGGAKVFPLLSRALQNPLKPAIIVSFFVMGIVMPFSAAELWQRVYASRDVSSLRKALITSALVYILIGCLVVLFGLEITAGLKGIDPDLAMVEGIRRKLPAGLSGLALVMVAAAIMSSADTYLFTSTSIIIQDLYTRFYTIPGNRLISPFRFVFIILISGGCLISVVSRNLVSVAFVWMGFGSVLAVSAAASWVMRRINAGAIIWGILLGSISILFMIFTEPIRESLVLKAIAFTLPGLFIGGVFYHDRNTKKRFLFRKKGCVPANKE